MLLAHLAVDTTSIITAKLQARISSRTMSIAVVPHVDVSWTLLYGMQILLRFPFIHLVLLAVATATIMRPIIRVTLTPMLRAPPQQVGTPLGPTATTAEQLWSSAPWWLSYSGGRRLPDMLHQTPSRYIALSCKAGSIVNRSLA